MTRLIDADALLPMMKYTTTDSEIGVFPIKIGFNTIAKVIDNTPTIDAVPVVRCKNCKYFTRDTITGVTIPGTEYCIFTMNNRIEENDFCSRAERKEE